MKDHTVSSSRSESQKAVDAAMIALGCHKLMGTDSGVNTPRNAKQFSMELILTSKLIPARVSASIPARSDHLRGHSNW